MIRELKTLIAVAQEGTFAAAGNRIGLTQAAVSAQIQRLEQKFGYPLFERAGRNARLNDMGRQLLAQAQDLIQRYEQLGSAPCDTTAHAVITIGAIASLQRSVLPDALAGFHREWPGYRSRVVPGLSMELVNRVDAGELDMAAVIRPPFSLQSDLRWINLVHEPFRLIVPRKLAGGDWLALLSSQPFIRYDRASFGGRQVDRFLRSHHLRVQEVCEVDELEAIVKLVANGVGVALAPQTGHYRKWPAVVRAIDLGGQTFHRDIGLVHRAAAQLGEPAAALARMIQAQARQQARLADAPAS